MSLSTLPPELLGIIVRHLDVTSVYNLYESTSCTYLRNAILMHGVPGVTRKKDGKITGCKFSLNSLATAESLRSNFFRHIAEHLQVLDLSAVTDLNLTTLIDTLSYTNNLKELDVSYTNITITDFLDIVKVRPTLESIAINISFENDDWKLNKSVLTQDKMIQYQQAFKQFKNVQFVVSSEFFNSEILLCMLQAASLCSFKLVFTEDVNLQYAPCQNVEWNLTALELSHFEFYFLKSVSDLLKLPIFSLLYINKYEIVVFSYGNTKTLDTEVYATPLLKKYIAESFDIEVENADLNNIEEILNSSLALGQSVFMFWNIECTVFDNEFYSKLTTIVKEYLVFNFDSPSIPVPVQFKWYNAEEMIGDFEAPAIVEFDYNDTFKDVDDIKLHLFAMFDESTEFDAIPKMIVNNKDFIKRLSHLSLRSNMEYHPNFFKNLFEFGKSLETLQLFIETDLFDVDYFKFVQNSISLKNIFIQADVIPFSGLFKWLSKCRSLENIYLYDESYLESLPDPTVLFKKCHNLYNFCIQRVSNEEILKSYKKILFNLGKHGLHVDLNADIYTYNPRNVFRLLKLKPEAFINL